MQAYAQFSAAARWLVPPPSERSGTRQANEWFMFRGRMAVTDPIGVRLRIAAASKYWLYVNGELVIREGGLKRGPVPDGSYFDELDLSNVLQAGENSLAILLWYFGRHGFSHRDSGQPGLLVDADAAGFGTWKVKRHPAYFDAGYVRDAYRLCENSIGYDARLDKPGWTEARFDDTAWPTAIPAAPPGGAPWGPLEKREIGQWFWSDVKEYESVKVQPGEPGDGHVHYRCTLPHNAQFVPGLVLNAPAGVRISLAVSQETNCLEPCYITREGEQRHEFIGWMNGEDVIYKIPDTHVRVVQFYYRETGYPAEFTGSFSCDEPMLNQLWLKARRTLYVTMRDNFMDCPCRERAQWPGDMVLQLGQVPYCLDHAADLLVKKGLRETLRWQREDGVIYGPVPEGNWRMELPAQVLSVLSPYGIRTYYMNTADIVTLEELYPRAKRYLDIWEYQESGLIKYRPGQKGAKPGFVNGIEVGTWDWLDWGEHIDAEPLLNLWMVAALRGVADMATVLDRTSDAAWLHNLAARLSAAINAAFWNAEKQAYQSAGFAHEPDDRVQAMAIVSGVADRSKHEALVRWLQRVQQASPYMEKYVLEALFQAGACAAAVDRMRDRYAEMTRAEGTTLWELFRIANTNSTANHSWSGGPLTLLSAYVAGLAPIEPGWRKFAVRPQPGFLNEVSACVNSRFGEIRLHLKRLPDRWNVELSVPPGTTGVVDLSYLGDGEDPCEIPGQATMYHFSRAHAETPMKRKLSHA